MKAYAILDGGGVKGAALAGALSAASDQGIEFLGYGGTSAGAIVALLAAVGFGPAELHQISVEEITFTEFLDDGGAELEQLKRLTSEIDDTWRAATTAPKKLGAAFVTGKVFLAHRDLVKRLLANLGLYTGGKLKAFLAAKISQKIGNPPQETGFTFRYLHDQGCAPLKVVAADLPRRAPSVYSLENSANTSVLDAVRASMSYPFVFRPVQLHGGYQVDGGLSSNLPLSVFEKERSLDGSTVMAFDLEAARKNQPVPYGMKQFCGDLLATALESGELLVRELLRGVHHVRIAIPEGIDTLDFAIPVATREALFNAGYKATAAYIRRIVPQWQQANSDIEALQASHAPPRIVVPVLKAAAGELERTTKAENVRVQVMLPTGHGYRVVTYSYNMDNDADLEMMLEMEAGCTGRSWTERKPIFADLEEAKKSFETRWKMTKAQQNRIPAGRRAMCSFPIFEKVIGMHNEKDWRMIGTLSFDSSSRLQDVWKDGSENDLAARFVVDAGKLWADIVGRLLDHNA